LLIETNEMNYLTNEERLTHFQMNTKFSLKENLTKTRKVSLTKPGKLYEHSISNNYGHGKAR